MTRDCAPPGETLRRAPAYVVNPIIVQAVDEVAASTEDTDHDFVQAAASCLGWFRSELSIWLESKAWDRSGPEIRRSPGLFPQVTGHFGPCGSVGLARFELATP